MSSFPNREDDHDLSSLSVDPALPSPLARALAFAAILIAGLCGGLIGYAITDLQISGDAGVAAGIGAVVGAVGAATGVAVVSVLALRAMTEWRSIEERNKSLHDTRESSR